MPTLENKIALVTGASRGIGRAAAIALAREGARVLVHYGRSKSEADSTVEQIHSIGGQASAIGADLESEDGPHQLAEAVGKVVSTKIDALVLNAGISKSTPFDQLTVAEFNRLFAVNVRAPYFVLQQLLPALSENASVTFVSSAAAHRSVGTIAAYASTKGAINTLVIHLAAALAPRGIRVNAIAPGVVATEMSSFAHTEAGQKSTLGMQALQRIAQPADIGDVFPLLASDAARWITGQILYVDGGTKL